MVIRAIRLERPKGQEVKQVAEQNQGKENQAERAPEAEQPQTATRAPRLSEDAKTELHKIAPSATGVEKNPGQNDQAKRAQEVSVIDQPQAPPQEMVTHDPSLSQEAKAKLNEAVIATGEAFVAAVLAELTPKPKQSGKNIVTVKEGFAARDTFTSKAGEITRQLGLAGIAVIWVFKASDGARQFIPKELYWPGTLLLLSLALDFLHYLVGAFFWQILTKRAQRRGVKEFETPAWITGSIWALFIAKAITIIAAYVLLLIYLIRVLTGANIPA
jgi:hypothetical protein